MQQCKLRSNIECEFPNSSRKIQINSDYFHYSDGSQVQMAGKKLRLLKVPLCFFFIYKTSKIFGGSQAYWHQLFAWKLYSLIFHIVAVDLIIYFFVKPHSNMHCKFSICVTSSCVIFYPSYLFRKTFLIYLQISFFFVPDSSQLDKIEWSHSRWISNPNPN